MSDFRRALQEKKIAAENAAPEGMELVGWKVFGEDKFSTYVLGNPHARPVYAFKKEDG